LLSGAEKMVVFVEATGVGWTAGHIRHSTGHIWLLAGIPQGLSPCRQAALPPVLLFACASIVGAFVHGSFMYLGEYVQALNRVSADSTAVLVGMLTRHRKIMIVTYGFLLVSIIVASVWFDRRRQAARSFRLGWPSSTRCRRFWSGSPCGFAQADKRHYRRGRVQHRLPDILYPDDDDFVAG
jgi:hypothetical protein